MIELDHIDIALDILEYEEGYRAKPYKCTEGFVTCGIGTVLSFDKEASLDWFKDIDMPLSVAKAWLAVRVEKDDYSLSEYDWYVNLNPDRKAVILSMVYNLGMNGFLKFKKFIEALECEDFSEASIEMLDSLWARQVPNRARRHSQVITTGSFCLSY